MDMVKLLKRAVLFAMLVKSTPLKIALRLCGAKIGRGVVICPGTRWPWMNLNIQIGDKVQIGHRSSICIPAHAKGRITIETGTATGDISIYAEEEVKIGRDCLFSQNVLISDSEHVTAPGISPVTSGLRVRGPVHIGDRCFVGKNVTILPGVVLGNDCLVGAGAVVTKSFGERSVIGGVPAKLIRTIPIQTREP
jgi:acetyltransferase-like isoleucine patch superfamily enzyme